MPDLRNRARGVYYTEENPFDTGQFKQWAAVSRMAQETVLEPFAGANNLINMLEGAGYCSASQSFDIAPTVRRVKGRDTINSFPTGFQVCVTNPPWLEKNSATRLGLSFPACKYDDLYKHCLDLCLKNCRYVAAIIPASFLQASLFQGRLHSYTLFQNKMFNETDNPACLSLFGDENDDVEIYHDASFIGSFSKLSEKLPVAKKDRKIRFNDPRGKLGFVSFDNVREPSIHFCSIEEIRSKPVKVSSRFFSRISGEFEMPVPELVDSLNDRIEKFRKSTNDVFLTPFKGVRKDGQLRRRMSFALAKRFVNAV